LEDRMPDSVTCIRRAGWIVAWDNERREHYYLRDADMAFSGNTILYVGPAYADRADHEIDGRGCMIIPGLINIHSHLGGGSIDKGVLDEAGAPALYGHALYTHSPLLRPDEKFTPAAASAALCELMLSGVTTTVDISGIYPQWLDLMGESGMRAVLGPGFRQARWINIGDHRVEYDWDEEAGWKGLERALGIAEEAAAHPSGRLSGLIIPSQADTCTAELIQTAFREAEERDLPFQIHAAQSMVEFYEILRRHGLSPVQWLDRLGVLSERTILGHCLYLDQHSWSPLHTELDLQLLADRGVTVAHCPTVFGRTGMTMETAGGYIRKGVRLGIGTDSFPYNMFEELRHAAVYSRIVSGDVYDIRTADLFTAATVGGARALGREDIGRLSEGARADFAVIDTNHPMMRPLHDPLRNLIYVAAERAVRDVYIDGRQVVDNGHVVTLDYSAAHALEDDALLSAVERVPEYDGSGRTIEEIAPRCFEVR